MRIDLIDDKTGSPFASFRALFWGALWCQNGLQGHRPRVRPMLAPCRRSPRWKAFAPRLPAGRPSTTVSAGLPTLRARPSALHPDRVRLRRRRDARGAPYCAKYPFTSIIKFVGSLTNTLMAPFSPAGTMAALATTFPWNEFSVETCGCGCPCGHVVR